MTLRTALLLAASVSAAIPALAVDRGRASGSLTIDGITTPLAFAVETKQDNLFDDKKQDRVIVLTDKPLSPTRPDDDVELSVRARRGELTVVAVRLDGNQVVNVSISHSTLTGLVILPGAWFQYTPGVSKGSTLKLAKRDFQGHSFELDTAFDASRAAPPPAAPGQNIMLKPRSLSRDAEES